MFILFHHNALIYIISFHLTTLLTKINKSILINHTNFTIEINPTNYILKNRAQSKRDI